MHLGVLQEGIHDGSIAAVRQLGPSLPIVSELSGEKQRVRFQRVRHLTQLVGSELLDVVHYLLPLRLKRCVMDVFKCMYVCMYEWCIYVCTNACMYAYVYNV